MDRAILFPAARRRDSTEYLGSTAKYSIREYIQYLGTQTLRCFGTRVLILSGTQLKPRRSWVHCTHIVAADPLHNLQLVQVASCRTQRQRRSALKLINSTAVLNPQPSATARFKALLYNVPSGPRPLQSVSVVPRGARCWCWSERGAVRGVVLALVRLTEHALVLGAVHFQHLGELVETGPSVLIKCMLGGENVVV